MRIDHSPNRRIHGDEIIADKKQNKTKQKNKTKQNKTKQKQKSELVNGNIPDCFEEKVYYKFGYLKKVALRRNEKKNILLGSESGSYKVMHFSLHRATWSVLE